MKGSAEVALSRKVGKGPLVMDVMCCPQICHTWQITSDEIEDGTQAFYDALWNSHDEHCRTSCKCEGQLVVTFDLYRHEPYESRRLIAPNPEKEESNG